MLKEYRNAIIGGVCGGLTVTILVYLIEGEVIWALIAYPIVSTIAGLIGVSLHKRREEKKYQQEKVIGQEG